MTREHTVADERGCGPTVTSGIFYSFIPLVALCFINLMEERDLQRKGGGQGTVSTRMFQGCIYCNFILPRSFLYDWDCFKVILLRLLEVKINSHVSNWSKVIELKPRNIKHSCKWVWRNRTTRRKSYTGYFLENKRDNRSKETFQRRNSYWQGW